MEWIKLYGWYKGKILGENQEREETYGEGKTWVWDPKDNSHFDLTKCRHNIVNGQCSLCLRHEQLGAHGTDYSIFFSYVPPLDRDRFNFVPFYKFLNFLVTSYLQFLGTPLTRYIHDLTLGGNWPQEMVEFIENRSGTKEGERFSIELSNVFPPAGRVKRKLSGEDVERESVFYRDEIDILNLKGAIIMCPGWTPPKVFESDIPYRDRDLIDSIKFYARSRHWQPKDADECLNPMWAFMMHEGGGVSRANDQDVETVEYDPFEKKEERDDEVIHSNPKEEYDVNYFKRLRESPLKMDKTTGTPAIWAQEVSYSNFYQVLGIPQNTLDLLTQTPPYAHWEPNQGFFSVVTGLQLINGEYIPQGTFLHTKLNRTGDKSALYEDLPDYAAGKRLRNLEKLFEMQHRKRDKSWYVDSEDHLSEFNSSEDDRDDVVASYKREIKPHIVKEKFDEYGRLVERDSYPWHEKTEMQIIYQIDKPTKGVDESTIRQINELHSDKGLGVAAIADELGVSKAFVSKVIEKLTSIKVWESLRKEVKNESIFEYFGTIGGKGKV